MKKRNKTDELTIHHSLTFGGSAQSFREFHTKIRGFSDIGYHAVIHSNGLVENGRDIDLVGAHARGKNNRTVGVVLIGNFHKTKPTLEQLNSLAVFYCDCCRKYGSELKIGWHRKNLSYDRYTGERNDCPGPMLDRKYVSELLKDRLTKLGVCYA